MQNQNKHQTMEETKTLDVSGPGPDGPTRHSAETQVGYPKPHGADGYPDPDLDPDLDPDPVLIHGLSVERYQAVYRSALNPAALAALSSARKADYVCQVLELKQRLWEQLGRPRLLEREGGGGRVQVSEVLDLT